MTALFGFLLFTQVAFAQMENGIHEFPCQKPIPEDQVVRLDFGRFCKYETLNAALPAATRNRVVYFGDSITEGWLKRVPGISPDDTLNRGVGGQTTAQMVVRFRADVLNLKPKIVHLMAGTNDVAGNTGPTSLNRIKEAFMSMTEQAQARGIRVILASVPPAKVFPWNPKVNPVPLIRAINRWLKEFAAKEGFIYVDYYSALSELDGAFTPALTFDGVHPNAAGYAVMERLAAEAIQRANM
jgi:lysophospholipase L1-like esterase